VYLDAFKLSEDGTNRLVLRLHENWG